MPELTVIECEKRRGAMSRPININDLLERTPHKVCADTGYFDVEAGKTIKTEISPAGGDDMVIGTVPTNQMWRMRLVAYCEVIEV